MKMANGKDREKDGRRRRKEDSSQMMHMPSFNIKKKMHRSKRAILNKRKLNI